MVINSLSYLLPTTNALIYILVNSITCRRANSHGVNYVEHNILTDDISTLFSKALEKFEPIYGHPTNSHLEDLREVLAKSSSSPHTTRRTRYINLLGSSKTQPPTCQTIPTCYPDHARPRFTTHRYATMRRHQSAPKRRRFTRPGGAILPLSKPRSARLEN